MDAIEVTPEISIITGRSERGLTLLMAVACGLTIANLYYCQPLLTQMGASLSAERAGAYIPTLTQVGAMFGMGLFVPLGDILERRRLIVSVCCALAATLMAYSAAPTFLWLAIASVCLGLTCIVPHLILPFAAQIARPEDRGRVLGTVLSGLLIGILCARTFSGFLGAALGWRAVYIASAGFMLVLAAILHKMLPESHPTIDLTYPKLLESIVSLLRRLSELREASLIGGMLFGAFSAFWATLIFRLGTPPFHYGSRVAGLFGLIGVAGAAAAPIVGRLADRRGARETVEISLFITAAAYVVFWAFGSSMWGLVAGVILMDLGVQAGHVSNQTRIYALLPEARSRLNTVYMVTYFLGGALGSALGAYGWNLAGWSGVCTVSLVMVGVALVAHFIGSSRSVRSEA
jgi:predicted MFS family arabinose efflux permease